MLSLPTDCLKWVHIANLPPNLLKVPIFNFFLYIFKLHVALRQHNQ